MTATKPYLVRALYEWCMDNGLTPHVVVWVNEHTQVPRQYVKDDEIVLNIGPSACKDLNIDNEWLSCSARFNGVAQEIWVPIGHISGLFARENGQGMGFEVEPWRKADAPDTPAAEPASPDASKKPARHLKLVK